MPPQIGADAMSELQETQRQQRTEANNESPFFKKLPAELRDRIYEMAIEEGQVLNIGGSKSVHKNGVWVHSRLGKPKSAQARAAQLGITHVCQQLRNETLAMFYTRTTFLVDFDWPLDLNSCLRWASSLPQGALDHMKHVMVRGWNSYVVRWATARRLVEFDLASGQYEVLEDEEDCGCSGHEIGTARFYRNLQRMAKPGVEEAKDVRLHRIIEGFEKLSYAWMP